MRRPTRGQDPQRKVQPASARAGGWMARLSEEYARLKQAMDSLRLRVEAHDLVCEPSAIVGKRIFAPDTGSSIILDHQGIGAAGQASNYVVRDGITYEIPLVMPPPGVFEARFLHVMITQRLFNPTEGIEQLRMPINQALSAPSQANTTGGLQTVKWSYLPHRFIQFFWNIVEGKSGRQLSDEMLPDMLLCPPVPGAFLNGDNVMPQEAGDIGYEFEVPWLFERDADIKFLFRPVVAIIQPAASVASPFAFEDREANLSVRDASVTVQVELHGSRLYTDADAQRSGADVDGDGTRRGGFG